MIFRESSFNKLENKSSSRWPWMISSARIQLAALSWAMKVAQRLNGHLGQVLEKRENVEPNELGVDHFAQVKFGLADKQELLQIEQNIR